MDLKGVEFNIYRDIKHSRVILVDRADERITYEVIHELYGAQNEAYKGERGRKTPKAVYLQRVARVEAMR